MKKKSILKFLTTNKKDLLKKIFKKKTSLIKYTAITASLSVIATYASNTIFSVYILNKGPIKKNYFVQPYLAYISNSSVSANQVKKEVMTRNIFNHNNTLPTEETEFDDDGLIKDFSKVPCSSSNEKLPVELIGILYTGNPKTNLVTLKDPQIETSDVYKEGQKIINNEDYEIYKIPSPSTLEMKYMNTKICLSTGTSQKSSGAQNSKSDSANSYTFSADFLSKQIGPGFSKILNSARLVPESSGGKTVGFKIFAIAPNSLFDKIDLKSNDIIYSVNGINLEDPTQGFKIYEALRDETSIVFEIKRAGVRMTKRVTVR